MKTGLQALYKSFATQDFGLKTPEMLEILKDMRSLDPDLALLIEDLFYAAESIQTHCKGQLKK